MYFSGCCITVQRGLCHLHQTWSNVILCRKSTVGLWDGVGICNVFVWICWYDMVWLFGSRQVAAGRRSPGEVASRDVSGTKIIQNHPKTVSHGWSYRVSRRVHHVHQFQALQPSTSATGPGYLLVSASPTLYQSKVLVFRRKPPGTPDPALGKTLLNGVCQRSCIRVRFVQTSPVATWDHGMLACQY